MVIVIMNLANGLEELERLSILMAHSGVDFKNLDALCGASIFNWTHAFDFMVIAAIHKCMVNVCAEHRSTVLIGFVTLLW